MSLQTERLHLTQVKKTDIPAIVRYANNPKIAEFTLNIPHPYGEQDALAWLDRLAAQRQEGAGQVWAIREAADGEFIGGIGLHYEVPHRRGMVGYWLGEPYWGKGYVTEALRAVLRYGFEERKLHKIYAHYASANVASGRVMAKAGMVYEGELKDHVYRNGTHQTMVFYRLLRSEWDTLQQEQEE